MSLNGEIIDNGDAGAQDEERRRQFKNAGKTKDEMRRRRVEENIEIRKAKRDDTMMKRRNVDLDSLVSSPESPEAKAAESHVFTDPIAEVKAAAEGLQSTEPTRRFNNLQRLRKVLSRESHPPIDLVIEAGLLPRIVELLGDPCEKTQFEAAWALTNIASGTSAHTQAVIDAGAVPPLLQLFANSTSQDVAEQALWGLGNIVGDGPRNRDAIIQSGIVPILMQHLKKPNLPRTFVKNIAWMISNLTRGKNPAPNFQVVGAFLPALAAMLESKDMECMVDSAWSLSYLSDGSEEQIEAVIEAGVVPPMVKLMKTSRDPRLLTPCVRTIGNVVTGSDAQTDAAVGCDVLPAVVPILDMPKSGLVKEACWLISNIAAGNHGQIQAVLNSGAMPKIISIMRHGEYRCQKEAAWVVTNVMAGGTGEQIRTLCEAEVIPPLCELMKTQDVKFVLIILDAVGSLLAAAQKNNFLEAAIAAIEECGGLDTLETMQNHDNEEVYQKSYAIIEAYFQDNEEDVVDTEAGGDVNQFQF